MKFASFCSGIEAASCAWGLLGWRPVFFSEIKPFPREVLKYRLAAVEAQKDRAARRGVPLWGDFTALRPRHFSRLGLETPDVLVAGTPCQAFSVAGKRRSLADDRGNLALEFVRPQYGMAVRRLTPTECERLQGFEDGWTLIPWRGRPAEECPDGPRYEAIGNSMPVPVMRWLGTRINAVLAELEQQGGLRWACTT